MKKPKRYTEMTEEERIKESDEYAVLYSREEELIHRKKKKTKKDYCLICRLPIDLCICDIPKFRVSPKRREK